MPPAIPANDAEKATSRELFGMSVLIPEPEVLQRELTHIGCKTLAKVIADLIADNEPMLSAEADGTTVIVRERGGRGTFRLSVEAI